jgi:hypothetical protein
MKINSKPREKSISSDALKTFKTRALSDVPASRFCPSDQMKLIPASELAKLFIPRRRKHWGEFIQSNQTGMIFGERGRGKTWVAMSIAISMSSCAEFLGQKPKNTRRVIYLDGEMDLSTFQQRVSQISRSLSVKPPANLRLFTPEAFTDLLPPINTPEGQKVIDILIGTEWDILFIDNYSAWSDDGRETAEAWAPFMRWMLGHKRAGRSVVVIHHSGKGGKQRGSSKHEDALDWSINLIANKQASQDGALQFSLVWEKSRHLASDQIAPIAVTMHSGEDGVLVWKHQRGKHTDPKIAKAVSMRTAGIANAEIAQQLDVDRSTVGRWLKAA